MTTRQPGGDVVDAYLTTDDTPEASMPPYHWTSEDMLATDPDGFAAIGEVSAGDYDLAADSDVWRVGDGRHANRRVVPDPDKLAAMRRVASRVVEMQDDGVLVEAMTEDELSEARGLARQLRETHRGHRFTMATHELAEQQAEAEHEATLRRKDRQLRENLADAQERHRKATDPSHRLVLLAKLAQWLPLGALVPGAASIALGAANAKVQLDRLSPDTTWFNWLIEPMFSVGVLVILVAQWLGAVPSALHSLKAAGETTGGPVAKLKAALSNGFFLMEMLLFVATVVLQVGIHYIGPGSSPGTDAGPLVWLFVPLGLLISMALVPATANRLNAALADAVKQARENLDATGEPAGENPEAARFSTVSDLRGKNLPEPGENPGENGSRPRVREPEKRTKQEAREAFFTMAERGEINPATQSVNDIAKALRTRWGNANEFIAEWRRHHHPAA